MQLSRKRDASPIRRDYIFYALHQLKGREAERVK
jgi:hypothetical protein